MTQQNFKKDVLFTHGEVKGLQGVGLSSFIPINTIDYSGVLTQDLLNRYIWRAQGKSLLPMLLPIDPTGSMKNTYNP